MPHHAPDPGPPPSWHETSRSTVHTITLKLEGQPPMRVEPTTMAANAAGSAMQFTPERMRLVIGQNDRGLTLISARMSGEHVARRDSLGKLDRTMPSDLGHPAWPTAAASIAIKIMTDIEKGATMGGDGKEDAGTADARKELEREIEKLEKQQGQ